MVNILMSSDFCEETRYVWDCECGQINEECDEPCYVVEVTCESCGKPYEVYVS